MLNPNHGIDLVELFERYFKLCEIKAGENVIILSPAASMGHPRPWPHQREYIEAATQAFGRLGAKSFHMELPPSGKPFIPFSTTTQGTSAAGVGKSDLSGLPIAMEAILKADFVLDLTSVLFSVVVDKIAETGTRMVTLVDPPEALKRLFPSPALKKALSAGRDLLDNGTSQTLRVSSKHGTDLTMTIGELKTFIECGYASDPGTWDCFPSGQVATCPDVGSGDGTIVLAPGDQVVLPYKRIIETPVTMEVSGGYIRSIEGGADAVLIRDTMELWDDPEVYALGHQSIGLHPKARWVAQLLYGDEATCMDPRIMKGVYLLGTGPNTGNGGTRRTPCHFDIPMRDCTIDLGDRRLVEEGRIVAEELNVEAHEVGY